MRLGTRGSFLARTQSQQVADELMRRHPGLHIDLIIIKTSGDLVTDKPLHEFGGKGLFTKELELALLQNEVDFAVHSFKDVPVTMPLVDQTDLTIAAIPAREDPRDVLATREGVALDALPKGSRVGTGSLRRAAQIIALRPDLQILPIRGNIDTRLRKLRDGDFDAVILAAAGLKRAALYDPRIMRPIEPDQMLPAAGQGALAIQCRRDDSETTALLRVLHDEPTAIAVSAEREIVRGLDGDCHSPIAALGTITGQTLNLRVAVAHRGGFPPLLHTSAQGPVTDPIAVAHSALNSLRNMNVHAVLHGT